MVTFRKQISNQKGIASPGRLTVEMLSTLSPPCRLPNPLCCDSCGKSVQILPVVHLIHHLIDPPVMLTVEYSWLPQCRWQKVDYNSFLQHFWHYHGMYHVMVTFNNWNTHFLFYDPFVCITMLCLSTQYSGVLFVLCTLLTDHECLM